MTFSAWAKAHDRLSAMHTSAVNNASLAVWKGVHPLAAIASNSGQIVSEVTLFLLHGSNFASNGLTLKKTKGKNSNKGEEE